LPPDGSASTAPHTLHVTLLTGLPKMSCSLLHLRHRTRRKLLLGFGISLFHSLIQSFTLLAYYQFSEPDAQAVPHVTTHFTLIPKRLLLRSLGKLALKRILLSTVTFLFPCVSALTLRQSSAFPSLVQRNRVNLMSFTMRTVSPNFFGNIHANRIQLSNRETHAFLYLFRLTHQKRLAARFDFRDTPIVLGTIDPLLVSA